MVSLTHFDSRPIRRTAVAALFCMAAGAACGSTIQFAGSLSDPSNGALKYADLSAASTVDFANNVALYTLTVSTTGTVAFDSSGFALGGVDPYFSLFQGIGNGASFLDSNYNQAFGSGGDFHLSDALAIGSYTIAIGAFADMSLAENIGSGSLGDGFIGLGDPNSLGNGGYLLTVTLPDAGGGGTVAEPGSVALCLVALAAAFAGRVRGGNASRRPLED